MIPDTTNCGGFAPALCAAPVTTSPAIGRGHATTLTASPARRPAGDPWSGRSHVFHAGGRSPPVEAVRDVRSRPANVTGYSLCAPGHRGPPFCTCIAVRSNRMVVATAVLGHVLGKVLDKAANGLIKAPTIGFRLASQKSPKPRLGRPAPASDRSRHISRAMRRSFGWSGRHPHGHLGKHPSRSSAPPGPPARLRDRSGRGHPGARPDAPARPRAGQTRCDQAKGQREPAVAARMAPSIGMDCCAFNIVG
jgi:hypothetical protein